MKSDWNCEILLKISKFRQTRFLRRLIVKAIERTLQRDFIDHLLPQHIVPEEQNAIVIFQFTST